MRLLFTGTGSAKTNLDRYHSSFLIDSKNERMLVDAGESISRALLEQKIDFNSIDTILVSHLHADHISGLAQLLTQIKMYNRKKELHIYVHKRLIIHIKEILNNQYLFPDIFGFHVLFSGIEENNEFETVGGIKILPGKNSHLKPKLGTNQIKEMPFIAGSFLIGGDGIKLFYTADIGSKEDLYLFKEMKFQFMISEAAHVSWNDIYEAFGKINPGRLFLTHIDPGSEEQIYANHAKLPQNEKERIIIADDGLAINLSIG